MGGEEVNDVFFTDCYVPEERVLGRGRRRLDAADGRAQRRAADPRRAARSASPQRAFDDVLAYVKERKQFGRPIGSFQALKHRIADLATEIECTRLLVYDVAAQGRRRPERSCSRARPRWRS